MENIKVKIDGPRSSNIKISCGNIDLGNITKLELICEAGKENKLILHSILNDAEIAILQENTEIIVNKLSTVDAAAAVSSKDLAEAVSRVGSSAENLANDMESITLLSK